MEGKRCPYCGRRISYLTTFNEKKRGLHICPRCEKECKIKTDLRLIFAFIAVVLLVIMFMVVWSNSEYYNNILGVVIVAAILILFYFCTPFFVRFVPLKKYSNYDEDEREYYDEMDDVSDSRITFNREIFDEVKRNRHTKPNPNEKTVIRDVPIIKDVSESHASSADVPLRRIENYDDEPEVEIKEQVKQYVPKKKPNGSTYTANRKF